MEFFRLAYYCCGILHPTFVANHNQIPKPKPKSNKLKQTKWIWKLQNYNLAIVEEP